MSDAHHFKSNPIFRIPSRCVVCKAFWTTLGADNGTARCPCGGELAGVDMQAHLNSIPKAVPEKK